MASGPSIPPPPEGASHFKLLRGKFSPKSGRAVNFREVPIETDDGGRAACLHELTDYDFEGLRATYGPGHFRPQWYSVEGNRRKPRGIGPSFEIPMRLRVKKKAPTATPSPFDMFAQMSREAEQRIGAQFAQLLQGHQEVSNMKLATMGEFYKIQTDMIRMSADGAIKMMAESMKTAQAATGRGVDDDAIEELRESMDEMREELKKKSEGNNPNELVGQIASAILPKIMEFVQGAVTKSPPPPVIGVRAAS